MDPGDVQMDSVFHEEPALIHAAAAPSVSASSLPASSPRVRRSPGAATYRMVFWADSLPTSSF